MIRATMGALLLAAPAAISTPVWAAGTQASVAAPAAPAADVERLADLLAGEEQVIEAATGNFDAAFDAKLKARSAGVALPNADLLATIRATSKTELLSVLHAAYPELRRVVVAKLQAELSGADVIDLIAFYSSPTGRKISQAAVAGARGTDPGTIQQNMVANAVGAIGADDTSALLAFGAKPAAAKLQRLGPELQQASVEWASRLMAANAARLQQSIQSAVQSYQAAHPGARSAK